MTKYLVRLLDSTTELEAETVNLGTRKLWFYDNARNLVAVFVWERIIGFEVLGSAKEQKFTDDLLHNAKAVDEKREIEIQEKGELWVDLKNALEQLRNVSSTLNRTWLRFYDTRQQKKTEMTLLAQRHGAELRQFEAQFTDEQRSLNKRVQSILDEFKELFSGNQK